MNTKQNGNNASNQNASNSNKSSSNNQQSGAHTGTQGGTHEQHVEAGRQSHKNSSGADGSTASGNQQSGQAASKQADRKDSDSKATAGTRGGTPEQHAEAGRQSHKNR